MGMEGRRRRGEEKGEKLFINKLRGTGGRIFLPSVPQYTRTATSRLADWINTLFPRHPNYPPSSYTQTPTPLLTWWSPSAVLRPTSARSPANHYRLSLFDPCSPSALRERSSRLYYCPEAERRRQAPPATHFLQLTSSRDATCI